MNMKVASLFGKKNCRKNIESFIKPVKDTSFKNDIASPDENIPIKKIEKTEQEKPKYIFAPKVFETLGVYIFYIVDS